MEVPKTIDISSLFRFPRPGGGADAQTDDKKAATITNNPDHPSNLPPPGGAEKQQQQQISMDDLPTEWRTALNEASVVANSIRHLLQPGVPTAMDRDICLWIALEEDIVSVSSDDEDDLDYMYGGDNDDDDIGSTSSGGSSDLSDGGYIVDEPNPFGKMAGKGKTKDKGSIVDDWTDDESAASDVSNWSDDNGKKKKKNKKKQKRGQKKQAKKGAASASSGGGSSKKKVLVSSKSAGMQKQLSAFGIKMTITNKTGDDGGGGKKRKSVGTTSSKSTTKKKKRKKKSSASTAAPNGKIRSELDKKPYAIGCAIVLRNLTGNDVFELNGKRGVVRSGISEAGKQEVEVNGREGLIPMSLENMRGVCPLFG